AGALALTHPDIRRMADGELPAEGRGGTTPLLAARAAAGAFVVCDAAGLGYLAEDKLVAAANLFSRVSGLPGVGKPHEDAGVAGAERTQRVISQAVEHQQDPQAARLGKSEQPVECPLVEPIGSA